MAVDPFERTMFSKLISEGALEIGDGYRAKNEELGGGGFIFLRAGHVTAPENIKAIRKDPGFVEFDGVMEYASKHPRAARHLASIRSQEETKNIDKALLTKLCRQTGVEIAESKGKVAIGAGHEMGFLEVLDRRRYEVSLVKENPEQYRAASRRKISC